MFSNYKSNILLAYKRRKEEGTISLNLLMPSPKRLKNECLLVFKERHSTRDLSTLSLFFGVDIDKSNYLRLIERFDIDKFRPLVNFLNNKTNETDQKNIELLAWLIDFEPRPFWLLNANTIFLNDSINVISKKLNLRDIRQVRESNPALTDKKETDGVFISYSWDNSEHEAKVLSFTDHLRRKGFYARLDKMLTQAETATNFVKMMHKAMNEHPKVIVVLSKGYKVKAETFTGGVGEEYQLLLNDIDKSPKKYILVSFDGRSDDIVPFGLKGRNIIDLSRKQDEENLFRKLMDQEAYAFSPVGEKKPQLLPLKIDEYDVLKQLFPITIEEPSIIWGDASRQGSLYKSLELKLILNFKNSSAISVDGLAYEVKILQQLIPDNHGYRDADDYLLLTESLNQKIFPNQTVKSKDYEIKILSRSKYQIIGSTIAITVYTDQGQNTQIFNINELFKVSSPNEGHDEKQPLSLEMFL